MTEQDKLIWKRDYLDPMFEKYEEIPTKLKYMFIEKGYIRMYGKQMTNDQMFYMYSDTEDFIFASENSLASFTKTVKRNTLKKYFEELAWNMYCKIGNIYHKYYSGIWKQDKDFL
jgi:hypothetical protein